MGPWFNENMQKRKLEKSRKDGTTVERFVKQKNIMLIIIIRRRVRQKRAMRKINHHGRRKLEREDGLEGRMRSSLRARDRRRGRRRRKRSVHEADE